MKKVLIVGKNSYIGESFAFYAKDKYNIETIGSLNNEWKAADFSGYDSVLHCAGIAHATHKNDESTKTLYYSVNCDLAANVAAKAKAGGVGQFIFMSSILVYGTSITSIDKETLPNPSKNDFYAGSKLKAETELSKLSDDEFKICIIRPPMVYGPDCKGNFPRLVGLAVRLPFFPDYKNNRSMIFIENLCEFFCKLIDCNDFGVFLPQNSEYVNTTELVKAIALCSGKKVRTTKLFNPFIKLSKNRIGTFGKMFGDLTYTKSGNEDEYNVVSFENSICKSITPDNSPFPISVSIITVTYNSGKTIKQAIESVLNQTIPPNEYLIIDGASSDDTTKIAESYRNLFENKSVTYKIISEADKGTYDAMNKGIRLSTGDIIGMINSDDWYEPHAIEKAIKLHNRTNYDMMFADLVIHSDKKSFIKKAGISKWVHSRNWNHPTTFTHKRIYKDNQFPLESIYDDFHLYLKLRKEKKHIVVLNEVLANYRLGGMSNERGFSNAVKRVKTRYRIYRKNGYSRIYILECFLIEGAKFLLA